MSVNGNLETNSCEFTWNILNFKKLGKDMIISPSFKLNNSHWKLLLFTHGRDQSSQDSISIYLQLDPNKTLPVIELQVYYEIMMKKGTGVTLGRRCAIHKFSQISRSNGWNKFIQRDAVQKKETNTNQDSVEDILSITCKIHMNVFSTTEVNVEKEILQNYASLFFNENFSDLTIQIGRDKMKVHKSILSTRSNVFQAMFCSNMKEKSTNTLIITDITYNVMKDVLLFIYSGKVSDLKEKAKLLLPPAEKYGITDLKLLCEVSILKNVKIEDAIETLITAELYQCNILKPKIIEYILTNMKHVNETSSFKEMIRSHPLLVQDIFTKLSNK